MSSQVIPYIIKDVVARVSTILTPQLTAYDPTIIGVNFLFGPPKQIIKILQSWNGTSKAQAKYPVVALFQPFTAKKGTKAGLDSVDPIRIVIGRQSQPEWLTDYRYQINITPVLIPIYDELMKQFYYEPRISSVKDQIDHDYTEFPFWDNGQDNNPFGDWLDVIEIKNMKLNVRSKNC